MKFNAVDWVRKVRDDNYEKCKKMSQNEKIAHTKKWLTILQRNIKLCMQR